MADNSGIFKTIAGLFKNAFKVPETLKPIPKEQILAGVKFREGLSAIEIASRIIERKKEIGELIISEVEDENFSSCSVESGGIDISKKFEAKAKLLVITQY